MQLEVLRTLDHDGELLLRERALLLNRDPEASLRQLQTALADGRLTMVCLRDDLDIARGIAAWRWQDEAHSYAQVLFIYLQPVAPVALGEALADFVFSELLRAHGLTVIEARVRDDSPGVWDAWARRGVAFFERCRMVLPLGQLPVPVLPVPQPYRIAPWTDEHQAAAERLAVAAYADSVDAVAVPDAQGEQIAVALRRLRLGLHGAAERWNPEASLVALDARGAVAGLVAVTGTAHNSALAGLAVDAAHRRRGLARLLVSRSMSVCLRQGCATMSAAVTTDSPARALLTALGFRAAECGTLAIWWRDGRHEAWRT